MQKRERRRVCLLLADTHGGSKLALCSPDVLLYEEDEHGELVEYHPQLTPLQEYLYELFLSDVDFAISLAGGDPLYLLHAGDLTEGFKHENLLVSNRPSDQISIAAKTLQTIIDRAKGKVKKVRLAVGTAAHVGLGGSSTREVAGRLEHDDVKVVNHGIFNIDSVRVDYAHHGPSKGIRDWTQGSAALWYLRSNVASEWKMYAKPAPRVFVRAHQHSEVRATLHEWLKGVPYTFDIQLLPSYAGINDFARKITRSAWCQEHGLVALEIYPDRNWENQVVFHPRVHTLDLRAEEKL